MNKLEITSFNNLLPSTPVESHEQFTLYNQCSKNRNMGKGVIEKTEQPREKPRTCRKLPDNRATKRKTTDLPKVTSQPNNQEKNHGSAESYLTTEQPREKPRTCRKLPDNRTTKRKTTDLPKVT
jgi:hypothetical protein